MKPTILTTAFIALLASVVDAQACSDNYTGPGCDTGVYDPDWDKDPEPEPEPQPEPQPKPKDPVPAPKKPKVSVVINERKDTIRRGRKYCPEPKKSQSLITDQTYAADKFDIAPQERCCVRAYTWIEAKKICEGRK